MDSDKKREEMAGLSCHHPGPETTRAARPWPGAAVAHMLGHGVQDAALRDSILSLLLIWKVVEAGEGDSWSAQDRSG